MIHQKILYTDGHEVTVTDSLFIVKKSFYQLKGITYHGFLIVHPDRLTPFLFLLSGLMMIVMGVLHLVPGSVSSFFNLHADPNSIVLGIGVVMFITFSLILGLTRERYAIRIGTAEGEKNVVVSRKKEYINQILDALNHAFINLVSIGKQKPHLIGGK